MPGIFNYCHTPINLLSNFDDKLQDFFKEVLKIELKLINKPNAREFKEALRIITENESQPGEKLCFTNALHRIVYVFRFSPCYTSAVANHFLKLVIRNPMILRDAMWRRQINICCLGGGPCTEVVALSKILSSAQDCFWQATKKPLYLKVTIVDHRRYWSKTIFKIVRNLRNSTEMFDQLKMKITFRFLAADLLECVRDDVQKVLQVADIITMVKSFCSMPKMNFWKTYWLMEHIAGSMKPDSVLFFLNTGKSELCHKLHRIFNDIDDVECIYGPNELEPFTLTLSSLRKNVEYFWNMFHENICLTSTIVNSCAWIKTDGLQKHPTLLCYTKIPKTVSQTRKYWQKQWQIKAIISQNELKAFHRKKVQRILRRKKFEDFNFILLSEYPLIPNDVLFCNKPKNRRIFLSTNVM